MEEFKIKPVDILDYMKITFPSNEHTMSYDDELKKWVITTINDDNCSEDDILAESYNDIRFLEFSEITTWKKKTIKDIGGEEAFNQEFDLRFINSSRSLLNEQLIEDMSKNKEEYEWEKLDELEKLKFSYKDLKWNQNENTFLPLQRKNMKIILSVDIAEGLGLDYSVINIFKIGLKPIELIESQKHKYKSIVDFFRLEQIGLFRSNLISVQQLSELLYLLAFEYFNPDNVKAVLEINTYGNELLAHMPHVFDGNNDYGSSLFFRFKHRADSIEEKIGLKIGENKNILVKEYQEKMEDKSIVVNNDLNISEVTTFIKHVTNSGNIRYAADGSSNDDTVMTIIDMCAIFQKNEFKQIIQETYDNLPNSEIKTYIDTILNMMDHVEGNNYKQLLDIRRKKMQNNRYKNSLINDWQKNNFK